jgi:hypothetical protein
MRGIWAHILFFFAVSKPRLVPPLDHLRTASRASLQSFELGRLNHAANLRREISALIDQDWEESRNQSLTCSIPHGVYLHWTRVH